MQHDLAVIAGVRQGLDITAHTGGKYQFALNFATGTETIALKGLSVFQTEIYFLFLHSLT